MKRFNDLSVATRLAIGFVATGLLFTLAGVLALRGISSQSSALEKVDQTEEIATTALQLKYRSADLNGWQTAYAFDITEGTAGATLDTGASRAAFLDSAASFRTELAALEALPLTDDQAAAVAETKAGFEKFMALDEDVIAGYRSGTQAATDEATKLVLVDEIEVFQGIASSIDETVSMAQTASADANAAAASDGDSARTMTLVGLALAIAAAIGLGIAIVRSILTPLGELRGRMTQIAEGDGDLTIRLDEERKDEFGQVGHAFNVFVGHIADAVQTIGRHAIVLGSSAEELTGVSTQMASNATHTAERANTSSSTANDVSAKVQTVAAATEEMTASAGEVARSAEEAATIASKAMVLAEQAETSVQRLGDSSSQIDAVAKLIGGIAKQTNLLALNATIEAARAGDAGKGFAVVATEVKDLATRSGEATADIARQVGLIQSDVTGAVEAISEIVEVIRTIDQNQASVAGAVQQQLATTGEISRNLADVSGGSDLIADDITAVASAAVESVSGAEDTQQAAEELARLGGELQELVGQFRT
jgi:methyl-accepting chemotaxis protein